MCLRKCQSLSLTKFLIYNLKKSIREIHCETDDETVDVRLVAKKWLLNNVSWISLTFFLLINQPPLNDLGLISPVVKILLISYCHSPLRINQTSVQSGLLDQLRGVRQSFILQSLQIHFLFVFISADIFQT